MSITVIGGGAAGCIAAILLAREGESVTLLEKNSKIGRKIYITGKGRCNLTADYQPQEFLTRVVRGEKFLRSALYSFTPEDTKQFFLELGVETITERGSRVFPITQKSTTVIDALNNALKRNGVTVVTNAEVESITKMGDQFESKTTNGRVYNSDYLIIATGGKTYPSTGSTGDGYKFAHSFGHTIVKPVPSLVAIITKENVASLKGLSLKNVRLTAVSPEGKELASEFGEMLFTDAGISGPIVLSVSARVNRSSGVKLSLDLKPALKTEQLDNRLIREFAERQNSDIANAMRALLPARLNRYLLEKANISPSKKVNSITVEERKRILNTLKGLTFTMKELAPFEQAVVTSGGVSLTELTPACASKLCDGLYFAGEVIDVDALTGGYNMQIAFSTASIVAKDILQKSLARL